MSHLRSFLLTFFFTDFFAFVDFVQPQISEE